MDRIFKNEFDCKVKNSFVDFENTLYVEYEIINNGLKEYGQLEIIKTNSRYLMDSILKKIKRNEIIDAFIYEKNITTDQIIKLDISYTDPSGGGCYDACYYVK